MRIGSSYRLFEKFNNWKKPNEGAIELLTTTDEPPLRSELYNVEQLERRANLIASNHQLATARTADKLLPRLDDNERVLVATYDLISAAAARKRRIAPAAEWLLDNFYLIEEQIRSIRRLLPRSYSGELPRLAEGAAKDYPRVYAIALELISHTDGHVDAASLSGFVTAYQSVVPLKLGELWAVPLLFRLALIENLRRVAVRIAKGRSDRDLAATWAERMIRTVEKNSSDLVLVLADMARANLPLTGAFLAELTRHLQGQNPSLAFATSWLEQRLADQGLTIEQLVSAEGQDQAADHVSVGNSITSLRCLAFNDWAKFVAEQSLVEQTLSSDPAGIYAGMDFATRNRYRHAVEAIAKRSRCTEYQVAHRAIQLAQTEATDRSHNRTTRTMHVGYFLVDRGRSALERLVCMRFTFSVVVEKFRRSFPLTIYLSSVFVLSTIAMMAMMNSSQWSDLPILLKFLVAIPILMSAMQLGIGLTNWLTSVLISPQPLPRMDFRQGIPKEHCTLVVVPTMLSSSEGIARAVELLEIRFLANRDENLHFALLTDLEDADQEILPRDGELVQRAIEGIELLNRKYGSEQSEIFYLFHRNRRWNAQESVWMGYERKRGKLADLNATLRGASNRFGAVVGSLAILRSVQYVITLDADTQLPRDAARQLVGAMAHTLNRPVFSGETGHVVDGYTILQPRVGVSLTCAQRSWFVKLFGGDVGVDPYTRVVSDLYQDLFGEGSFIGKGIYDVDSFEKSCNNFPENAILSHDLLESCFCRSALLTDVILYEDFPASFSADSGRRHRWMRGDWQIAGWLLPRVRTLAGPRIANPISALAWWKIFDNLRRSLLPIALLSALLIVWLFASADFALIASLFLLAVITLPTVFRSFLQIFSKPFDLPLGLHLVHSLGEMGRPLAQCFFTIVFIPFDAFMSGDAVIRTIIRVNWTKRNLLEWRTSSDSERSSRPTLLGFFRSMWFAPMVALIALLWIAFLRNDSSNLKWIALPILVLWMASPMIGWWLSRPIAPPVVRLSEKQRFFLRKQSRKTWHYFETFVTEKENWLPPDNVKLDDERVIAHRTSPTNIGLALLSNLTAYDFGYCSVGRTLDRIQKSFDTLAGLERHRGHFFNWYDTQSLAPLNPRYV